MSISKLPDELIGHVSTFLDINSIAQFAQTNYRIYNIIKKFKADRSFVVRQMNIQFMLLETTPTMEFTVYGTYLNGDTFNLPRVIGSNSNRYLYEKELLAILNKFKYIEHLSLYDFFLEPLMFNALTQCKPKIGHLSIHKTSIRISTEQMIEFLAKYDRVHMNDCWLPEGFLKDEVFGEVLSKSEVTLNSCKRLFHLGLTDLTDKTLEVLVTQPLKREFSLSNMSSHFTIQGIRQTIEQLFLEETFNIYWDLGIIANAQLLPAMNFLDEVNNDANVPYYIKEYNKESISFLVMPKNNNPYRQMHICFEVAGLLV